MTLVNIDLRNQGYETGPDDRVIFYSLLVREGDFGTISTAPVEVELTDGKASVDLAPGPVGVQIIAGQVADTRVRIGEVPPSGPTTLNAVMMVTPAYTPALQEMMIAAVERAKESALGQVGTEVAKAMDVEVGSIRGTASEALTRASKAEVKADSAVVTSSNVATRVAALESREGLAPESPVDGQTANLLTQPDTLTSQVLRNSYAPVDAPLAAKRKFMSEMDSRSTRMIFTPRDGHGWTMAGDADGGSVTEDTSRPGPFSDRSIKIHRVSASVEIWNGKAKGVNLDDGPLVVWVHMPFQSPGGFSILLGNSFADRWQWDESSVQESSVLSPHIDGWTAYELYPERAAKIGDPLRHSLNHLRVRANGSNYTYWLGGVGQRIAPVVRPRLPERVVISPGKTDGITLGAGVEQVAVKSPNGTSSYQLTYTAGSAGVLATGLTPASLDDLLEQETVFWLKFPPGMTQPAGVQVDLYGDEISQSSRYQLYIYGDNQGGISYQYPGWVGVRLTSKMGLSPIGTPPAAITAVRVTALSGNTSPVLFGGVEVTTPPEPLYPHGVLTIFFDDGYLDTYEKASRVLGAYGFPGVVSAIAAYNGTSPNFATIPQLREMQDRMGWEIAGHSWSPNGLEYRFTELSPDALEAEFRNLKTWLVSNGFDSDTWVSPGGMSSRDVWQVGRKYFAMHRGVGTTLRQGAHGQSPRPVRPSSIVSPNYSATSVDKALMKSVIDATVAARSWGTITFHQVIDGPSSGLQISVSDLDEICAHAAASGVAVRTVRQILEEAN